MNEAGQVTGAGRVRECTIIIATLARRERASTLDRAISSLRTGNRSVPNIVVVVNGDRFDRDVVNGLKTLPDVRVHQIPTPSLPAAILAGRQAVETPYFGFLDDDDEYLPGAIDARLGTMATNPRASILVTNGYRNVQGRDRIAMSLTNAVESDPLAALFSENWLASCGGLFRTHDFPPDLFVGIARYLEWTWLAFQIASARKTVAVLDQPTFRIHDTEGSESKSDEYFQSHVMTLARMLTGTRRRDIRALLRRRIAYAYHDLSNRHLGRRRLGAAWISHLRSLAHPSIGWRFLPFTRHLVSPDVFRRTDAM